MRKIAKASAIFAVTAVMTTGMAMTAMAGQWVQDQKGWRYQKHDGSYLTDCSQWLDGNQDGIAECYYFDASGYMYSDTSVPVLLPDGSTFNNKVNADGQMIGGKPTLVDNQWILDDTKPWIMESLPTLPVRTALMNMTRMASALPPWICSDTPGKKMQSTENYL